MTDFISLVPGVETLTDLKQKLRKALKYQSYLYAITTPWDAHYWNEVKLTRFYIDMDKIDRLYHMNFSHTFEDIRYFSIIVRMKDEENRKLYVELTGKYDNRSLGYRFISGNTDIFMYTMMNDTDWHLNGIENIVQSLKKDDIKLKPPTLKYICHLAVYNNKKYTRDELSSLPDTLRKSVIEFNRMKYNKNLFSGKSILKLVL